MDKNELEPIEVRQFDQNGPLVQSRAAITVATGDSAYVGIGYEPRTNTGRNRAIKKDISQRVDPSVRPEYAFEYIESYSEMASTLSVSVSTAYGAEGISGGSASLNLFKSTKLEKSSAYVVFKMRMIAKVETTEDAKLVDDILKLLNQKQYLSLVEKYGTSFARTVRYGGELAAILEFKSTVQVDTETFHNEIKVAVGDARGEANMDSSVMKLTTGRSVSITYAQSGGDLGNNQNGVLTITTDQLIERIRLFPKEVKGTTGLDGSTVPLSADMSSLREATNWPADNNTNLDYPYPPDIESTARTVDMLYEKLSSVDSILSSPLLIAPSVREAAMAMRPYLEFEALQAKLSLIKEMASTVSPIVVKGESFYQYRVRRLLNVPSSSSRENAGGDIDMTEPDKGLLATQLFGKDIPFEVRPWPDVTFSADWGYQGEHDGMSLADDQRIRMFAVGHHVPCPDSGGNADVVAAQIAGKASPDAKNDGIFAYATHHPSQSGGAHCGYSVLHFSAFRISVPDKTLLPTLPDIPHNEMAATLQQESPVNMGENKWALPFSIKAPSPRNCGKYTINIELRSHNSNTKRTEVSSYWIGSVTDLKLRHTITLEDGWEVSAYLVMLDSAYGD